MTTVDRNRMLEENLGHARRRYEDRSRKLRLLGLPDEPTIALIIDCRDREGERIAKLNMDESYFHQWCAAARKHGVPTVTLGVGLDEAVALLGRISPDAEDQLLKPAPAGMFATAVVANGGVTFAFVPVEGESLYSPTPPLKANWLTSFLPPADHTLPA
jgi:hypothetical protein